MLVGSKPYLQDQLISFSALTLLVVIWPVKIVPDMTYNVFGGTLNLAQSVSPLWLLLLEHLVNVLIYLLDQQAPSSQISIIRVCLWLALFIVVQRKTVSIFCLWYSHKRLLVLCLMNERRLLLFQCTKRTSLAMWQTTVQYHWRVWLSCKLMERVIAKHIYLYLANNNLLSHAQHTVSLEVIQHASICWST